MKLLAVDSSGLTASVAVYNDGVIVACQSVNNKKTHSQTLLPMIRQMMEDAGIRLEELDGVAIANGPGSFTGLRIGASTVKGLCLAVDKPVISVSTLAGLANNLAGCSGIICPIMDARRKQVYTALYSYTDDDMVEELSPSAMGIEDLVELVKLYQDITFVGDGIPVHMEYLKEVLGDKAHFAKPHMRYQNAASVAVLAEKLMEEGRYISSDELEPEYLRLSQAEREKLERERNS